jgi:serine-type D-Ala-D-Ala carboxypeptidase
MCPSRASIVLARPPTPPVVPAVIRPLALALSAALAALTPAPRDGDPHVTPADVGMSAERLAVIDRVMQSAVDAGGFPGAAVIVGRHGAIVWERGYGTLGGGSSAPVDPRRTVYDLASLTKVVATATAAMVLVDQGRLGLDDPVARYLPEFRGGQKSRVTIRHLLAHRSGLPAGRGIPRGGPAEVRRAVLSTPLYAAPGESHEYSDLGAAVLGFVVERVTGEPLDRFVQREVYAPLGMRSTTFRPSASDAARTAPTDAGGARGRVHDPLARALGGVAGHAGLFATASDLACSATARTTACASRRTARSRRSPAAGRATVRRSAGRRAPAAGAAATASRRPRSATPASPARRSGSTPSATCS